MFTSAPISAVTQITQMTTLGTKAKSRHFLISTKLPTCASFTQHSSQDAAGRRGRPCTDRALPFGRLDHGVGADDLAVIGNHALLEHGNPCPDTHMRWPSSTMTLDDDIGINRSPPPHRILREPRRSKRAGSSKVTPASIRRSASRLLIEALQCRQLQTRLLAPSTSLRAGQVATAR
jgi:hypothetical protein